MLRPVLRRPSIVALAILFVAAVWLALSPSPIHAETDPVTAYNEANDRLAQLILEREALEASISTATVAERSALQRLDDAEGTLSRLVADRRATALRRAETAARIEQVEAQAPMLESVAASLEREIQGHERWLLEGEPLRALGSRAYRSALDARDRLSGDRDATTSALAHVRERETSDVLELGRLNTEIVFWEQQGDALSRQVGRERSRALNANARLLKVHKDGLELAGAIRDQVGELRRLGYPIGVGFAAEGFMPVPAPLDWPAAAPRGYVIPSGALAGALRAAEPIRAEPGQPAPLPVPLPEMAWTIPVRGPVTTPFGDSTPYQPAHWAIDIGSRLYEPIRAAADGVAEFAGLAAGDNRLASYGMVIVIRHDERLTSLYSHLDDRAYGALVLPGEPVKQGQVIGYVGLTGNTTGPHLHFEARLDGRPLDPLLLVKPAT